MFDDDEDMDDLVDMGGLFADEDDDDPEEDVESGGDERAVSFPEYPPGKRYGKKFADTWWGNAWIEAMEDTALDPEQLKKGRRYAFAGMVGAITVTPGRITAAVHDGDYTQPYTTVVRFEEVSDAGWDRFLDQVAGRAGHIAALLDRDMPRELVDAASDAGVRLLPSYGDLSPDCDCPTWDSPCKHAAALSYQVSWLLDRDPFVLLLVRGRGEAELMAELHRRNARRAGELTDGAAGTPATEAWAASPVPLPAEPLGPVRPMDLAEVLESTEEPAPVDPAALAALAAGAAAQAGSLLAGVSSAVDDPWVDAVQLTARSSDEGLVERTGRSSGRAADFGRAVAAQRLWGAEGRVVLESAWTPPKDVMIRARTEFVEAWRDSGLGEPAELTQWRNRWTADDHDVQLRLGHDGRWYPFRATAGGWTPAGLPTLDPAEILMELLRDPE